MVSFEMKNGVITNLSGDESEVEMVKDTVGFVTDEFETYEVYVTCEDGYVFAEGRGDDDEMINYTTWVGEW